MLFRSPVDSEDDDDEDHDPQEFWQRETGDGTSLQEARVMALVQLRRAVRGTAFALGALAQFRDPPGLEQTPVTDLTHRLRTMNDELHAEMERLQLSDSPTDE